MDNEMENEFEPGAQNYDVPPVYGNPAEGFPPPMQKKEKKRHSTAAVIALVLCFSILGLAIGGIGVYLVSHYFGNSEKAPSSETTTVIKEGEHEKREIDVEKIKTGEEMTPAEVYAANVNATVGIRTTVTTNFWGYQTTSAAAGSGFIISSDGYILTCFHVVENSNTITVTLYDDTTYDATIVGYDSGNDLAVLKVDAKDLQSVVIGKSDDLVVGDQVVAIGNPLGELTFSMTHGIVSAMDRTVTLSNGVTMNLLQTDCTINSGNSGGALFNLYGEVVGIPNSKYSNNGNASESAIENVSFAIPIDLVYPTVQSIIQNGYVAKPYLGISVTDVSEEMQSYGLPQGAIIKKIEGDSPAVDAGLQVNDIITEFNGKAVTGQSMLIGEVGKCEPNQSVSMTVYRQGQTIDLEIKVGERIQQAVNEEENTDQQQQQQQEQQEGQQPFNPFDFFSFPW